MSGSELQAIMELVLPEDVLMEAVEAAGFVQRRRKREALKFLRAMLLSAASPSGGRQADIMRTYFERQGGAPVARGSFYDWFGPALERVLERLAQRVLAQVRQQEPDLPGPLLGCVDDWLIVDSTTVRLDDRLQADYPGTGEYAALKVHKTLSVGCGTVVDYHFSPAREHDSPHLELDESWREKGLLVDLGYASLERLRQCQRYGVRIVIRLKQGWKPKVERIVRGDLSRTFAPGTDLELVLQDPSLVLGNCIDADVTVGADRIPMRLIGVLIPGKGYYFYLTNLPRSVGPRQIAELYRVRWEVELNNKLDKSSHRLDEIDSCKPAAVRALIHATMISSMLVGLIVHQHNLEIAREATDPDGTRTRAPLHHGLVARELASCGHRVAAALDQGPLADAAEWAHLAKVIVFLGTDTNWRHKPSVLDRMRGYRVMPSRRTQRIRAGP
jgi:hypothetical protein